MKTLKFNLIIYFVLCLLFVSCSKSKNPLQLEAEQLSQQWFDNTVAKCDDNFVIKYKGPSIEAGRFISRQAYFQLKELSYTVVEVPVTEADKLNGIEWQGLLGLQPDRPTYRYYDFSNMPSDKWADWYDGKWSEWQTNSVSYSGVAIAYSNKVKNLPNTPFIMVIKKVKGKWQGFSDDLFKPECSEVPKDKILKIG